MEKCSKKVTHTVRVVGKKRVGFVCPAHLELTKKICVQINEKLHVEKYEGDEMFCQLPAGAAGPESEKAFCYQPNKSSLNPSRPPQGGSGVPRKNC